MIEIKFKSPEAIIEGVYLLVKEALNNNDADSLQVKHVEELADLLTELANIKKEEQESGE